MPITSTSVSMAGRLVSAESLEGWVSLSIKVYSFICLFIYINNKHLSSIYQVLASVMVSCSLRRDISLGSLKTQQVPMGL